MQSSQLVLPQKCMKCGAVFDLWHFLREQSEDPQLAVREALERKEFLCWGCREQVGSLMDVGVKTHSISNDETSLEEEEGLGEMEFVLED